MRILAEFYEGPKLELGVSILGHHVTNGISEAVLHAYVGKLYECNPSFVRTLVASEYTIEPASSKALNFVTEIGIDDDLPDDIKWNAIEDIMALYQLEIAPNYRAKCGYSVRLLVMDDQTNTILETQYIPTEF